MDFIITECRGSFIPGPLRALATTTTTTTRCSNYNATNSLAAAELRLELVRAFVRHTVYGVEARASAEISCLYTSTALSV